jgi:hypothetical protein
MGESIVSDKQIFDKQIFDKRITVDEVVSAYKKHGYIVMYGTMRDDKRKACCGLGAVTLDMEKEDRFKLSGDPVYDYDWYDHLESIYGRDYTTGFFYGFDDSLDVIPETAPDRKRQGWFDGIAARRAVSCELV